MKYIVWGILLLSPLFLLNYMVMPELEKLGGFYSNIDSISQTAAGTTEK